MNVQAGDLAYIARKSVGLPTNHNKLVRVIKAFLRPEVGEPEWICEALQPMRVSGSSGVRDVPAGHVALLRDSSLRPLRDRPGDDETLTWAGLPSKPETVLA